MKILGEKTLHRCPKTGPKPSKTPKAGDIAQVHWQCDCGQEYVSSWVMDDFLELHQIRNEIHVV